MRHVKKIMMLGMAHISLLGGISANAEFPNQWSGGLPRPILFVHGIGTNGYGEWGFERPSCSGGVGDNGVTYDWFITCSDGTRFDRFKKGTYLERGTYSTLEKRKNDLEDHELLANSFGFEEVPNSNCLANYKGIQPRELPPTGPGPQRYQNDVPSNNVPPLELNQPPVNVGICKTEPQRVRKAYPPSDLEEALSNFLQFFPGLQSERYIWDEGISTGYKPDSTPEYFANRYGLSTQYDRSNPNKAGINHNGIEFYNIAKSSLRPLTTGGDSYIHPSVQAERLRKKVESVLDEYYSDWRTNPNRTIDIVAHSQGGLVTRSMLYHERKRGVNRDPGNALNHINHIVTTNTPHLGTAFAHSERGVSSMMRLRDYIFNDIENMDSVNILGLFGTVDFLPKSELAPFNLLDKNADHLRYACHLHHPAWEPNASDVASTLRMASEERVNMCVENEVQGYEAIGLMNPSTGRAKSRCRTALQAKVDSWLTGNDTDCSSYLAELREAGYPTAPNGRMIPMTAMYGRVNPDGFIKLIDAAKDEALEKCGTLVTVITLNDCKIKVRKLVNGIIDIVREGLANEWIAHSDLIVDVSSQVGLGLFEEGKHPFRKVEIRPLNTNAGVYHINMREAKKLIGETFPGATWHAEEIFNALQTKPKVKINLTAPYLLLLQN